MQCHERESERGSTTRLSLDADRLGPCHSSMNYHNAGLLVLLTARHDRSISILSVESMHSSGAA